MQCWHNIPEDPPNKCPKQPLKKPWWDVEQDEQWAKMGLHFDDGEHLASLLDEQTLNEKTAGGEPAAEESEGKEIRGKDKDGKNKEEEEEQKDLEDEIEEEIDVNRLVAMWTGKEGLVVPPGLNLTGKRGKE